jgi:hypothetical protein
MQLGPCLTPCAGSSACMALHGRGLCSSVGPIHALRGLFKGLQGADQHPCTAAPVRRWCARNMFGALQGWAERRGAIPAAVRAGRPRGGQGAAAGHSARAFRLRPQPQRCALHRPAGGRAARSELLLQDPAGRWLTHVAARMHALSGDGRWHNTQPGTRVTAVAQPGPPNNGTCSRPNDDDGRSPLGPASVMRRDILSASCVVVWHMCAPSGSSRGLQSSLLVTIACNTHNPPCSQPLQEPEPGAREWAGNSTQRIFHSYRPKELQEFALCGAKRPQQAACVVVPAL